MDFLTVQQIVFSVTIKGLEHSRKSFPFPYNGNNGGNMPRALTTFLSLPLFHTLALYTLYTSGRGVPRDYEREYP